MIYRIGPFHLISTPLPSCGWNFLIEVNKDISDGVSQSASFDLASFPEGYSAKWAFILTWSRKLGLFVRCVLCQHFDLPFPWG